MTSIRGAVPTDLFRMSLCNLDPLVENYDMEFYFDYLIRWPEMFLVAEDTQGRIVGYSKFPFPFFQPLSPPHFQTNQLTLALKVMGKVEEDPDYMSFLPNYLPWHGHVTALTVAPCARRQGLAKTLTAALERACDERGAWFMDLFVREGNAAVDMYRGMGYSVYRRVVDYYSDDPTGRKKGGEDAFDMRKPLSRDVARKYVRENGEEFRVSPEELYGG